MAESIIDDACDILVILRRIAARYEIGTMSVVFLPPKDNSVGHIGVIHYVTISDGMSEDSRYFEMAVKRAATSLLVRTSFPVGLLFGNECYFYEKIWPAFKDLQTHYSEAPMFDAISSCYETDTTPGAEKIVMMNLKLQGFDSTNRREFWNHEYFEWVFEQYGIFHALSMAHKVHDPAFFYDLSRECYDHLTVLTSNDLVQKSVEDIFDRCLGYLKEEGEDEIVAMFESYSENILDVYGKCAIYRGNHAVITHGDCWSNNMMFKYEENEEGQREIVDMRFLDFQLTRIASPVHDLSYCLFSNATEEVFENVEYFLHIYYQSLSNTLDKFNLDPGVIYPFQTLVREWKEHCQFGFIMGLVMMGAKLVREDRALSLLEIFENPEEAFRPCDEELMKTRALALIKHMYRNRLLDEVPDREAPFYPWRKTEDNFFY